MQSKYKNVAWFLFCLGCVYLQGYTSRCSETDKLDMFDFRLLYLLGIRYFMPDCQTFLVKRLGFPMQGAHVRVIHDHMIIRGIYKTRYRSLRVFVFEASMPVCIFYAYIARQQYRPRLAELTLMYIIKVHSSEGRVDLGDNSTSFSQRIHVNAG